MGISSYGRLTFGLRKDGKILDLLYGHPNDFQVNGIQNLGVFQKPNGR